MIRRTEVDTSLAPVDALRSSLTSFIGYVEENPDNYKSLVRGAVSGDAEMRTIFDETRTALARRIITVVGELGLEVSPRVELAIQGWVAYVEECVIRWIDGHPIGRDELLEMLTTSLPAVTLSATDGEVGTLVSILTAGQAISTD